MQTWTIERAHPEEWERVRAIRLRALADAPDAFGTTLAEDEARAADDWRERLDNPDAATFLASNDDADIGMASGERHHLRDGEAWLYGMWVAPAARRCGVGEALVEAVASWSRDGGCTRLLLEVADDNDPAVGLYSRMGFEPTGRTSTLPAPREHVREHERARSL